MSDLQQTILKVHKNLLQHHIWITCCKVLPATGSFTGVEFLPGVTFEAPGEI